MSEKKVSIEVDVKIDSARSQVESLSKSINTKLKDKKINLKVDTRQVMQSFTGITNQANKSANKIAQAFAKAFDSTGKSIKNINKNISNVMAKTADIAKLGGTKAGKAFANAFNKAIKGSMKIFKSIGSVIIKGITSALMGGVKLVFKAASFIGNAIVSALKTAINTAKKMIVGLANTLGKAFQKTYEFTIEANAETNGGGGSSSSTSSSLLNAGMLATSLKAITAAAAQNSMPKELGNVTARLADRLITAGQNALTFGKFAYQAYVMIRSNWPKIISTLSSIGEAVLPHIKSAMRDAGRAISEITKSSLIPGIKKILSAASEKFQEAVEKMCNSTNPYIRAMGYALKMLVKITEGCKLLVNAAKKVIDALEWIGDKVVKVFTAVFHTFEWIGDKITKVFTGVFSTLEHIGNGIVGFGKIIWQATTDLPGALAKLTEAILSACKTIASKVKEAFMGLKDRIKNWWNGVDDSSSKSSSSSYGASAGGVKGGSATSSRDTFNWSSDAQKLYTDYLNDVSSAFAASSQTITDTKQHFDALNQSVSGSSISLDEMIKTLRSGNGNLRENTIKDITSYFSSISAESFDYSQLEEPTKRIIDRMADTLIQIAEKYERMSRRTGSYGGSSSSNVEKPKGKYGLDWAKDEQVEVEVEPEKKSLKGFTEKIKKAVKSVGKSKVDVDVDSSKVDKLKNKVQEVEKAAGDTAEESFVDKIKSIDDAIMAYAKFENSVNAVLHPVKTLKQELMKKIAFGTLEDLGKKSIELTKRFNDLKQSVKALKNMDAGQEKTAASLKVLGDSAKLAVSKLKLVLKANTVGKLIEKMKGPADKATKELAEKVPGGKDNINLFKGAISKLGLLFGGIGLFGITKEATNQAIKYEAALGQLNRRLGESASVLDRFASSKGLDLGLSRSQVAEYGNIFSVYVSQFESDAQTVADTTQSLLEAAAKTAQATGYDLTTVMDSFRSGLTGSQNELHIEIYENSFNCWNTLMGNQQLIA